MTARVRVFRSPERLARRVREAARRADGVSFDLFDTLLVRRVHDPDLLKAATARFIARTATARGRPGWTWEKIQRLRDKVEAMHRRRAGRSGPDREACYPAFMADTLRVIAGADDPAWLQAVTDYELRIESSMLVPRATLCKLAAELKALGLKIAIVSDVYLPASHLRRLLDAAGLGSLADTVYSSADTAEAKASGAAWPRVAERWGVAWDRWLHVGDHPVSDGARPAERGIAAFVLRDPGETQRKALSRTYWTYARKRPFWRGRLAQQWMMPLEAENEPRDPLFVTGYNILGPMLCAHVHHVAERCLERGLGRVFFFSREGRILLDLWERIAPVVFAGAPLPEARYLHVSRLALAGAACAPAGLEPATARIAFLPASNRDFRDLCRVFSLPLEPLRPWLARHGLREDTPLSRWHAGWNAANGERLRRLLEDPSFQEEVRRLARPACDALHAYLESEGFFSVPRVALVDIGWLGTMQRFLHQALRNRTDRPELHGLLFATSPGYAFPHAPDNRLEGFFHDPQRTDFCGSLVLTARDLFEETTRADHPGLLAYRPGGSAGYELEFRSATDAAAEAERRQTAYFAPLQEGIRAAGERYGPALAVLGYGAREWKPWLNGMAVSRLAFPKTEEVRQLRHLHHQDDFAGGARLSRAARRSLRQLWTEPLWALRWKPWLRPAFYLKHAVHMLRYWTEPT